VDIAKVQKEQVWIVFRDVKRSDWAMAGTLLKDTP
jgi:phenylpyruvate tautomerase PptA (4-oxalocrotonate tautomerase family)